MNQLFHDQSQGVFIKVLSETSRAERELVGAAVFSQFTNVARVSSIDSKVILINKAHGLASSRVSPQWLNTQIVNLILTINSQFSGSVIPKFSIDALIDELELKFCAYPNLLNLLSTIRSEIADSQRLPVHGDLQKQNIIASPTGELTLIDFEHFCFAPQEMELVNSLFHQDSNCLDMGVIIPALIKRGVLSTKLLSWLLVLYALKEIAQGVSPSLAWLKLNSGLDFLSHITGEKKCLERSKPDSVFVPAKRGRQLSI